MAQRLYKISILCRSKQLLFWVIFFSDAIVAIAITLLALNLKLEIPPDHRISFADLLLPWRNYLAFILSFVNIAGFWRTHHNAFLYIYKMDDRMMFLFAAFYLAGKRKKHYAGIKTE